MPLVPRNHPPGEVTSKDSDGVARYSSLPL